MSKRLIIDTDTASDDAVALVMALGTAARAEQEQFAEVSFI